MLTRQQKEEIVKELSESIKNSPACIFVDFKGVSANEMVQIKREMRENNSSFQVIKKTLLKLALSNNGIDADVKKLEGQIAVSVSPDEITSAKVLAKIGKANKNLKFAGGVLEGELLDREGVEQLAKMPSLDELRAMALGLLQSPAQNVLGAITAPQKSFAGAMETLAEKKAKDE